jgi:hypothetical protein
MVKIVCEHILPSPPNLAPLRPFGLAQDKLGGSQIPVFDYSGSPENLREPRKF